MREFTKEEKELIVNTPITQDCFEMGDFKDVYSHKIKEATLTSWWSLTIEELEFLRKTYNKTKDERYFIELVRLLPNTYKVVKL